jgi:hypothetical protein
VRALAGAALIASALWAAAPLVTASARDEPEKPRKMRQIIAQAICLAEAYPDTTIAHDGDAVVGVYVEALGARLDPSAIEAVRALAREARPSAPSIAGQHNMAIARCELFADRRDVIAALSRRGRPPS